MVNEAEGELAKHKLAAADAESRRDELEAECEQLRGQIATLIQERDEAVVLADGRQQGADSIRAELETLREAGALKDTTLDDMRGRIKELEARSNSLVSENDRFKSHYGKTDDRIAAIEAERDEARSELATAAEHAEALQAKLEEYKDARAAQATEPGPTPDAELRRRLAASDATRQGLEAFRDIVERHRRSVPVAVRDALDGVCG
jgi:chromosome segregation ATPase